MLFNESGDSTPVAEFYRLDDNVMTREILEELRFGMTAGSFRQEVGDLGDNEYRHDDGACVTTKRCS